MVQASSNAAVWLFPKGTVEDGEKAKVCAVRETCEEAGVVGSLGKKLGEWHFANAPKVLHKMWILYVEEEYSATDKRWKERKKRLRQWVTPKAARELITSLPPGVQRPELVEILDAALAELDQ